MKKTLIATLAFILSISALGGCTGKSAASKSDSSKDSGSAAVTTAKADLPAPDPDKTYHITLVANQQEPIKEDAKMIAYWNKQFNIDLEVINVEAGGWDEQIGLLFAAGTIPDMIRITSFSNYNKYMEQDVLAAIPDEMMNAYMPGITKEVEKEIPGILKYGVEDGTRYAVPSEILFHNQFRSPIVYRGDWMAKVGVTKAPETLEELETLMYKFTNEDPDGNGKDDTYGLSATSLNTVYGAFGYIRDQWKEKDGKLIYTSIQPEMKEALATLHKWYEDGVLDPEYITGENKGGYWAVSHSFAQGRIGLSGMGNYYHWSPSFVEGEGANIQELRKNYSDDVIKQLKFGVPPIGPDGKSGTYANPLFTGGFEGLGKQLEDEPDKMAKIMQMWDTWCGSTKENFMTTRLGIQGEMWDYDTNGNPASIGDYLGTTKLSAEGAHTVCRPFDLMKNEEYLSGGRADWAHDNKFDVGGITTDMIVSLPSAGIYQTELTKIKDEAYNAIITGDQPIDYFDEFVTKWKAAGGDVLTKEANDTLK